MKKPRIFIAGVMQGNNPDASMADQEYRRSIANIIKKHMPEAEIFDPLIEQMKRFATRQKELLESASELDKVKLLYTDSFKDGLKDLTQSFHEICTIAGECNALIAYIPKGQASMGTAVEMWCAYTNKKPVITVSELKQNLTVLACSDIILPSLKELDQVLSEGWLSKKLAGKLYPV